MKIRTKKMGDIFQASGQDRAESGSFPVMSITMHHGLIDQSDKFKKRVASTNTSNYKIVYKNELVVGFPIDEGVIGFQTKYKQAIVSPAYDIWKLKDDISCNIDFIGRYLRSNIARQIYASKMRGAVARRRSITKDDFLDIQIPFPPLDDQIRISTVLTRAEKLITKRKESIEALDELLKSTFLEMFGDPVRNEKGWEKKRIDEIAKIRIGPFGSLLHAEDYVENGIPLINPSHIIDGEVVPDFTLTITPEKFKELEAYQLKINDVVIARRGEIGRCAIVRTAKPLFCGTGSMFIRIISDYYPLLLQYQIYNTSLKEYLESKAKGVTMKNLNSTTLGDLQILHPPLPLQKQFVVIVDKVESLKEKYTQGLNELEKLYSSVSQRAFKGELDLSGVTKAYSRIKM
jgi:type I restriction enzyme S subunit